MRTLIFDIDGTILLNGPILQQMFESCFAEVAGHAARAEGLRYHGRTDRGIFRLMMGEEQSGFESRFEEFRELFSARVRAGYPEAEGPHLLPGVARLLERLTACPETTLVLGTGNIRDVATAKLDRFGLAHLFAGGGFGGDHELRADLVRAAMDAAAASTGARVNPQDCWVIGDTLADIDAARVCGARVLAVATGPSTVEELAAADVSLPDLSDTARVLEILCARRSSPPN